MLISCYVYFNKLFSPRKHHMHFIYEKYMYCHGLWI